MADFAPQRQHRAGTRVRRDKEGNGTRVHGGLHFFAGPFKVRESLKLSLLPDLLDRVRDGRRGKPRGRAPASGALARRKASLDGQGGAVPLLAG